MDFSVIITIYPYISEKSKLKKLNLEKYMHNLLVYRYWCIGGKIVHKRKCLENTAINLEEKL